MRLAFQTAFFLSGRISEKNIDQIYHTLSGRISERISIKFLILSGRISERISVKFLILRSKGEQKSEKAVIGQVNSPPEFRNGR